MTLRIMSDTGAVVIGLTRGPLLDNLLREERVCLPGLIDPNGLKHPHVCLFVRGDNDALLRAVSEYFPRGYAPGAAIVHVEEEIKPAQSTAPVSVIPDNQTLIAKLEARVAQLEADVAEGAALLMRAIEERAAANARIAELERLYVTSVEERNAAEIEINGLTEKGYRAAALLIEANARADAAERAEKDAVAALDANWVQHQRIVKAEAERDQLKEKLDAAERESGEPSPFG